MNDPHTNKSLGQHWLNDDAALEAVCDGAAVGEGDWVLEIGPGPGSLTKKLLQRGARVTAVEYDEALADALPERLRHAGVDVSNLKVEKSDILTFDLSSLPRGYKVVANIPYYLTSHILRVLCESQNPFSLASLLVQKEVAERVSASPGAMSTLSVSVQLYCDTGLGPIVPARLFTPPPKVDSQILLLEYGGFKAKDLSLEVLFRVVKAGFSERRKKLRSSLSGGLRIEKAEVEKLLAEAGLHADARAQELSIEEWVSLAKAYANT